jgi:hypothetical protein
MIFARNDGELLLVDHYLPVHGRDNPLLLKIPGKPSDGDRKMQFRSGSSIGFRTISFKIQSKNCRIFAPIKDRTSTRNCRLFESILKTRELKQSKGSNSRKEPCNCQCTPIVDANLKRAANPMTLMSWRSVPEHRAPLSCDCQHGSGPQLPSQHSFICYPQTRIGIVPTIGRLRLQVHLCRAPNPPHRRRTLPPSLFPTLECHSCPTA